MNNYKTPLISSLFILFFSVSILAQESTERIEKSYQISVSDNFQVHIQNLHGSIDVETYNGKMILLEASKNIKSRTQEGLQKGKSEIQLATYEYENGLFIYLDHPCAILDKEDLHLNYNCNNNRFDRDYKFNMDITVKVPKDIDFLDVSTINNGDVTITGLQCDLDVNNVNGSITVNKQSGNVDASTVNGDVSIHFSKNPEKYAEFSTINGDIEVNCLTNLSAKIQYKSMHGDFFTNYDNIAFLPSELKTSKKSNSQSTKYKLTDIKSFKIGNGDAKFKFNTLNGDMFLTSN